MTAIRSKFPRFIFGSVAKNAAPQIFTFLISAALLLQAANTNARTGEGSRVPYTTQAIMRLLQGDVPPARVATLAAERDIEFDLDADLEKGFRKAGADDELIQALSKLGPRAHFKAGLAAAQNGRDHVAMVELKKATDLRPDYVEAHLALADEYKMRAPNSWIEEEYRKAVRYGGGVKARLALADHLESTDQYEKAAVEYRTLIRDRPNDSDFHIALARSLQRSNNLSEAITEFKEAIRLGNKKQNTYSALATLLDKQGDHDGAIAEYREAIRLCATGSNDGGNHVRPAGASVNTKHDLPTFVPPCAADHEEVARLLEIVGKKMKL
jgi:tetratricopeptide (TPR) repeat protein